MGRMASCPVSCCRQALRLASASVGAWAHLGLVRGAWQTQWKTRDSMRLEGPLTQGRQSSVTFGMRELNSSL